MRKVKSADCGFEPRGRYSDAARRHVPWWATWQCENCESTWARGERSNVPWKPPSSSRTSAAQHSQLSPQRALLTPAAAVRQPREAEVLPHSVLDMAARRQVLKSRRGDGCPER